MIVRWSGCFRGKRLLLTQAIAAHFRFSFSTEKRDSDSLRQKMNADRLQKQNQVQFRRRALQNAQIKKINDRIQTTKGNFNPIIAYIKLYRRTVILALLSVFSFMFLCITFILIQVFEDPFTKRKQIVLLSSNWQRSLDGQLRQIVQSSISGQFSETTASSSVAKKVRQLQQFISRTTGREYKIGVVQSADEVIVILPSSILISKNLLVSGLIKFADVQNAMLLLETLFVKKLHVRQLAASYILFFIKMKVATKTTTDIKLIDIYSRSYSPQQVEIALSHIEQTYRIPPQQIRQSLCKFTDNHSSTATPFALGRRIPALL